MYSLELFKFPFQRCKNSSFLESYVNIWHNRSPLEFQKKRAFKMFLSLHIGVFHQNIKAVKVHKANTKSGLVNNKYSIEYFLNKNKARLFSLYVI